MGVTKLIHSAGQGLWIHLHLRRTWLILLAKSGISEASMRAHFNLVESYFITKIIMKQMGRTTSSLNTIYGSTPSNGSMQSLLGKLAAKLNVLLAK